MAAKSFLTIFLEKNKSCFLG